METILEAVGHTPLIEIRRALPKGTARLFAKLERFNPGGSVKDRIILKILGEAERKGEIREGGVLIAATTGNSGIALAYMGSIKKYKVILMMPENYSRERQKILEGYGAEVYLTPAAEGIQGALHRAKEMAGQKNGFLISQFEDPLTVRAHEETTALEIEADLGGAANAVVIPVGTGGSLMGIGGHFKKKGAQVIAVEPAASPMISEGRAGTHRIEGIGLDFLPPLLRRELVDDVIVVSDRQAFDGAGEIAKKEGILVGISGGAAFVAARRVARSLGPGKTVVTVFADGGERYLSVRE